MRFAIATVALFATASAALAHAPDPTHLPLGDGKLSSGPRAGYIWACHTDPNGRGAQVDGPWIDKAAGTFDITRKAVVDGAVTWPHSFRISVSGNTRVITWNDLPAYPTGTFPIARSDDAYRYDRNPNRIKAQSMRIALPLAPQLAAEPSCAPGAVGVLLTGVALFNALDAPGRDAVAHETQDACQGHPQEGGVYHNHNVSICALKELEFGLRPVEAHRLCRRRLRHLRPARRERPHALLGRSRRVPRHHQRGHVGRQEGAHVPLRRHGGFPLHHRLPSGLMVAVDRAHALRPAPAVWPRPRRRPRLRSQATAPRLDALQTRRRVTPGISVVMPAAGSLPPPRSAGRAAGESRPGGGALAQWLEARRCRKLPSLPHAVRGG